MIVRIKSVQKFTIYGLTRHPFLITLRENFFSCEGTMSKTTEDLLAAFAGESQANRKYLDDLLNELRATRVQKRLIKGSAQGRPGRGFPAALLTPRHRRGNALTPRWRVSPCPKSAGGSDRQRASDLNRPPSGGSAEAECLANVWFAGPNRPRNAGVGWPAGQRKAINPCEPGLQGFEIGCGGWI